MDSEKKENIDTSNWETKKKGIFRSILKWFFRIIAAVLILFVLLLLVIQIPAVQTYITGRIAENLSERTGTEISVQKVSIRLFSAIGIKGIYVEDLEGDTLLYARDIRIDVNPFPLINNRLKISNISLEGIYANIEKTRPDTVFNFQFITDSFQADTAAQREQPTEEPSDGMEIILGDFSLEDIRLRFSDYQQGIELRLDLGNLETNVPVFQPDSMKFHLGNIYLENTVVDYNSLQAPPQPPSDDTGQQPDIMFKGLYVENLEFNMNGEDDFYIHASVPELDIEPKKLDLQDNLIHIEKIFSRNLVAQLQMPATESPPETETINEPISFSWQKTFEWDIEIADLDLHFSSLEYSIPGQKTSDNEFDPGNINVSELVFKASDIIANPQNIETDIESLRADFPGEFEVVDLTARINLGPSLSIDKFRFQTHSSSIEMQLFSELNPLEFNMNSALEKEIDLQVSEAVFSSDLAYFVPELNNYLGGEDQPENLQLVLDIDGEVDNMNIADLYIYIPGYLSAQVEGDIQQLPDIEDVSADLKEINIEISPLKLAALLPDTLLPPGMVLPDTLSSEGFFTGGPDNFKAGLDLYSSAGNIMLSAAFEDNGLNPPQYDAEVDFSGINPGQLLNQQGLPQNITGHIDLSGKGLEPGNISGNFNLVFDGFVFNQYEYNDLQLEANAENGIIKASLTYNDDNLSFNLNQQVSLSGEYPAVKLDWEIVKANLEAINISEETIVIQSDIDADMALKEDFILGDLLVSQVNVLKNDQVYSLDSIFIDSNVSEGTYQVEVISDIVDVSYSGNISPAAVPGVIINHLENYMPLTFESDSVYEKRLQFELDIRVPSSGFITDLLIPQLSFPEALTLNANFDSNKEFLSFDAELRELSFGNLLLDSMQILLETDSKRGNFRTLVQSFESGGLVLSDIVLEGNFNENQVDFLVEFDDQFDEKWLSLPGNLSFNEQGLEVSFDTDLVINKEPWNLPPDNLVFYAPELLFVRNLRIKSDDRYLLINTVTEEPMDREQYVAEGINNPLDIQFHDIDLSDFSILEEEPLLGGLFNGFVSLRDIFSNPAFTADLSISHLAFRGDTIGNVEIMGSNPRPEVFMVEASVSGNGNNILIEGNYRTADEPVVDADVILENINLNTLEGFLEGVVSDLSGNISGKINVEGNPANPVVDGSVNFKDVEFIIRMLGSNYIIPDETLRFDRKSIQLSSFTVLDSNKDEIYIDGSVNISDFENLEFDLSLLADEFLLLNVEEEEAELFWGKLIVDTDLQIEGNMASPVVEGRLGLNEGSSFSFVIPQTDPEAIGAQGIVSFISPADTLFQDVERVEQDTIIADTGFQNLELSLNIVVDPKTELQIIIDQAAGDNLHVTGGGVLSFGMDPGGQISLTGMYEINQGSYLLTFYDAIRRNFSIQEGSTIQWQGEPMDAIVDITAVYTVLTSAQELLVSQMQDGGAEGGALRQQFPFNVLLMMEGELQNPEISFAINLPEEEQDALQGRVQTRLSALNQDESELNKQVFALLVLGNFVHENPLASIGQGPGLSATARRSASRILSQQLNKLSNRYVPGVDINFDIESYEDYSTGEPQGRTELELQVSRNFLDERLRISVGGNIELEDETRQETDPGEIAGDFMLEYLLNEDGTLILKAFRTKDYGDLFEAQVFETGVSLIFTRSYNVFRELFRDKEEDAVFEEFEIPEIENDDQ